MTTEPNEPASETPTPTPRTDELFNSIGEMFLQWKKGNLYDVDVAAQLSQQRIAFRQFERDLAAARAEVERLNKAFGAQTVMWENALKERDSLRAELERVKQERDEAHQRIAEMENLWRRSDQAKEIAADNLKSDRRELEAALSARDEEIRQLREQIKVNDANRAIALHNAISALYYEDDSEYHTALWEIAGFLDVETRHLFQADQRAAFDRTESAAKEAHVTLAAIERVGEGDLGRTDDNQTP